MTGGYDFTRICLLTSGVTKILPFFLTAGVPHPSWWGYPILPVGEGDTLSCWWGCTPIWPTGGYPCGWWGYPHPTDWGYPHLVNWGGYPIWLMGVTPPPPPLSGLDGITPPPPFRRQSSRASTCYTAGGMPLVFTQEDFFDPQSAICFKLSELLRHFLWDIFYTIITLTISVWCQTIFLVDLVRLSFSFSFQDHFRKKYIAGRLIHCVLPFSQQKYWTGLPCRKQLGG